MITPFLLLPAALVIFIFTVMLHQAFTWFLVLMGTLGSLLAATTVTAVVHPLKMRFWLAIGAQFVTLIVMTLLVFIPSFIKFWFILVAFACLTTAAVLGNYAGKLSPIWDKSETVVLVGQQLEGLRKGSDLEAVYLSGNHGATLRLFDRAALVFEAARKRSYVVQPGDLTCSSTEVYNDPGHLHVRLTYRDGSVRDGHMLAADYDRLSQWNRSASPASATN